MAAPNSTFCVSTCCAQPELNDGAHQKRPRATIIPCLTGSVHCRGAAPVRRHASWLAGVWGEASPRVPPEARPNVGP